MILRAESMGRVLVLLVIGHEIGALLAIAELPASTNKHTNQGAKS